MAVSKPNDAPVTRFAPSPTGFLHIGGARTALFNWLFARAHGGVFLLRIEDTDRARHSEAAVAAILDGLSWLGLDWDGDPISQAARSHRHRDAAHNLLAAGKAYRCYMTADEIDMARNAARAAGGRFVSPWRDAEQASAPDRSFTIRFRAPVDGETIVEDAVQGAVRVPNAALDDLIILRSGDGGPTYNLAVVVDDHDMGVTHVIRGDDHLMNAARQQQIYEALGWPVPQFAHVPLIHGPDGAKLSKRHGALGVEAYRDDGYLPAALFNYLLRLGWGHGDEEIIPIARALEIFDIKGVTKAPARLDIDKLNHINASYINALDPETFLRRARPFIEAAEGPLDGPASERLQRAAPYIQERSTTLKDAPAAAAFALISRPLKITGKAAKPLQKEESIQAISDIADRLERAAFHDPAGLDAVVKAYVDEKGVGFGVVGQPVRAALTGGAQSPSLGAVLYVLGREEALARLRDQLHNPH